ncbi:hypothetical protein ACVW1C_008086 [Bradyrhizobium sp. USDA 4011]
MIAGTERAELELSGFCITFLGLGAAPSAYISSGRRCAFRALRRAMSDLYLRPVPSQVAVLDAAERRALSPTFGPRHDKLHCIAYKIGSLTVPVSRLLDLVESPDETSAQAATQQHQPECSSGAFHDVTE